MSPPRRPTAPGSGRRGDETPSGPVPRAGRGSGRSTGPATSPRGVRGAVPRSGSVPRVGGTRPASGRSTTRPARGTAPPRNGTPAQGTPRTTARLPVPRMFTVRAMVFSVVVLLAFVLVYPTLSTYLQARSEVQDLRAARDAALQENADLEAELRRWEDDAYIVAQARERLSFVMPGETAFRVVDPETVPQGEVEDDGPVPTGVDGVTRPWYTTVWESVQVAGRLDVDGTDGARPAADPAAPPDPAG